MKIVNWTLTMWGGKLRFTTAMLFAIGLIVEFTIGGLSGVTHAVSPSDTQQTDTYYIVAHFHYVLFGGAVFGIFAGFYYWWPKVFGKMLSEKLGKWNFWLMIIGMNLTFGPMHILGLQGQPRRMYVWTEHRAGEGFFNLALLEPGRHRSARYILAIGVFLFLVNVWHTTRKGAPAPLDPWDARSLEWMTTSPPKEHNFDAIPTVHALDEFFHRKYEEVDDRRRATSCARCATAEELMAEQEANADTHIHMPSPSYWPIVLALALPIMAYGIIYQPVLTVVGGAIVLLGDVRLGARAVGRRRQRLRPAARRRRADEGAGDHWLTQRSPTPPTPRRPRRRRRSRRARRAHDASRPPDTTHRAVSNNKLAMWLFLGSECLLFGGLISTYMLYRGRHTGTSGPTRSTTSRSRRCRASCC